MCSLVFFPGPSLISRIDINDENVPADVLHADKYVSKIPCRSPPYVGKNVSEIQIEHWLTLNELEL